MGESIDVDDNAIGWTGMLIMLSIDAVEQALILLTMRGGGHKQNVPKRLRQIVFIILPPRSNASVGGMAIPSANARRIPLCYFFQ